MSGLVKSIFGKPSTIGAQRQQAQFDAQQRQAAADKEAAAQKSRDEVAHLAASKSRGRASTLLAGGKGLMEDDTAKRYLL